MLSEFIAGIIQESVPKGEFRHQLEKIAISIVRDRQNKSSQNFLPEISCSALGGDSGKVIPITAAWQFIRLAAKLYDDVEDEESGDRGAEFTNLATGYLFAAQAALEKLPEFGMAWEPYRRLKNEFCRACLETCAGQAVDLSNRWDRIIPNPDDWINIAKLKSGMLFAWSSWAGALVAGVKQEMQENLREYGLRLGILVQIADDYNGVWGSPSKSDLLKQRVTLPVSYALFVAKNDERETLIRVLREANQGKPDAQSSAWNVLTAFGAQKFILAAAQVQREGAIEAINRIGLTPLANQEFVTLLDDTFPALAQLRQTPHDTNPLCPAGSA